MPSGRPPSDEASIRAELQRQGIDNFGQLISAAAQQIRERGGVDAERWSFLFGDWYVFVRTW
jgi:hypothetical protein